MVARNLARAGLGQISEKWPDSGFAGARPEIQYCPSCKWLLYPYIHYMCVLCVCFCPGVLATFLVSCYYIVYIANSLGHRVSFMVFFLGAMFCMGSSAVYHVFICHSETICKLLAKYGFLWVYVCMEGAKYGLSITYLLNFCFTSLLPGLKDYSRVGQVPKVVWQVSTVRMSSLLPIQWKLSTEESQLQFIITRSYVRKGSWPKSLHLMFDAFYMLLMQYANR